MRCSPAACRRPPSDPHRQRDQRDRRGGRVRLGDADAGLPRRRATAARRTLSRTAHRRPPGGLDRDDAAGQRRWADDTFRWRRYGRAESGLRATAHAAQGRAVTRSIKTSPGARREADPTRNWRVTSGSPPNASVSRPAPRSRHPAKAEPADPSAVLAVSLSMTAASGRRWPSGRRTW